MLFNSVWSLLVLLYLVLTPLYAANLYHKLVATGLNTVTAIFWFAGSIALAVVTAGGVSAAATAFGFFLWCVYPYPSAHLSNFYVLCSSFNC